MLIDFHVHVYPDKIADRAVNTLAAKIKDAYDLDQNPHYDGTTEGLKRLMAEDGVDISVIMPIALSVTNHISINRFAEEITGDNIISFASLHPYQEDVDETLKDIAARGFRGIKLHPDYQGVYSDDEKCIALVNKAADLGLHTVFHSGKDPGILPPNRGAAAHMREMLKRVDQSMVTLAHLGAFWEWDEVESWLVDSKAYFDTAVVSGFMDIEQYRRIIDRHGADRIVFGSDLPWERPRDTLAFLKRAGLSDEELELITHKNAERILGL